MSVGARPTFGALIDADALALAASQTVRGKRRRPDVQRFALDRHSRLARLQSDLERGRWQPARFELLFLTDPKRRVIARAPLDDRIVHRALVNLLEPAVLRSASCADYACREGFGTHRAVLRLLELVRRFRFFLHLDVRAYFPSVDPDWVFGWCATKTGDARLLEVIGRVLRSGRGLYDLPSVRRYLRLGENWPPPGRGLPVGAATSQMFVAHCVLQELDHELQRRSPAKGYLRYVDDLFLFADRRGPLREVRRLVETWLRDQRGMRLRHPLARVRSCQSYLDGLGFRIRREGIEALPGHWRRFRGAVRAAPRRLENHSDLARESVEGELRSRRAHLEFGARW